MKRAFLTCLFMAVLLAAFPLSLSAQSKIPPAIAPDNPGGDKNAALPRQTDHVQAGIPMPPPPQAGVGDNPGSPPMLDMTLPMPDVRIVDNPDDGGGKMAVYSIWGSPGRPYTPEQFAENRQKLDHVWVTRADTINGQYENVIEIPLDRNFETTDKIGDRAVFYRIKAEKGRFFRNSVVVGPVKAINNGGKNAAVIPGTSETGILPYILLAAAALVALIVFIVVRRKKGAN